MRVLSIEHGSVQEVKSSLGSLSSKLSPRYVFHTLVPPQRTKHSLHFVSRAYDKPEINERSSVDPRVLMEPILSLLYVAEIPLSLPYTPLKRSYILEVSGIQPYQRLKPEVSATYSSRVIVAYILADFWPFDRFRAQNLKSDVYLS